VLVVVPGSSVVGSAVVLVLVGGAAVVGVSLSLSLTPPLPSVVGPAVSLPFVASVVVVSPDAVTPVMFVAVDASAVESPALPLQAGSSAATSKA